MDLIVRNAQLRNRKERVDIAVKGEIIAKVGPGLTDMGAREIDAQGMLVTPT